MRRNVAGQFVGAQINSKTDGSEITTGTVTAYVTGDAGTQAAGSVGSGACTHEGHGFWTYAPAQAETNYTHVAFTFVHTSGITATVQLYPISYGASGQMTGVELAADQAVNATKIGGTTQTGRDLGASVLISSGTGAGQLSVASGVIAANVTQIDGSANGTHATGMIPADVRDIVGAAVNTAAAQIGVNTVNIGGTTQTGRDIGASVLLSPGTGTGQISLASGSVEVGDKTGFELSANGIQYIWERLTSNFVIAGSVGKLLVDILDAAISTRSTYAGGAVASVSGNVDGNVTGTVGGLATQAKADVNGEVVDALNVDAYGEPGQEALPVSTNLVKKIGYLYKVLRNKVTEDGSEVKIYADDGTTVDNKGPSSDSGGVFTKGEIGSGP